ncbi:MAG: putative quinol monooxygenase [Chloroflexota bacterium]
MSKVILKGHIIVPENDLAAVEKELVNHIRLTRQEEGCLIFKVTQDPNQPQRFDVYEEFVNQDAFDKHQQRVKSSYWGKVAANVARHYEISK